MDVIIERAIFGAYCIVFGVGLTIARDIPPHTLKFVAVCSFLVGFMYKGVWLVTDLKYLGAFTGCFVACLLLKLAHNTELNDRFFAIAITTVYCICPGTSMGLTMHTLYRLDMGALASMVYNVVMMTISISAGLRCGEFVANGLSRNPVKE